MNRKIKIFSLPIMLIAGIILGQAIAGNLPQSPIDQILEHKTDLQLSESQIKNLNLVNSGIINKMLQCKSQVQMNKAEIEKYATNWADMENPKFKSTVKDYYRCLADMKALEFEALAQAGKILTPDQIKQFSEQVSIDLVLRKTQLEMVSAK
jgi:hypothetical protein